MTDKGGGLSLSVDYTPSFVSNYDGKEMLRRNLRFAGRGFTLIEVLVVILIIGILASYFGQNIFGQTDDAKFKTSEVTLSETIPAAFVAFVGSQGRPAIGEDMTAALVQRGVPDTTPWGKKWSASIVTRHGLQVLDVAWPLPSDAFRNKMNLAIGRYGGSVDANGFVYTGGLLADYDGRKRPGEILYRIP